MREDLKRGVFIEGISEETTSCSEEAIDILNRGARNRHVGATQMNSESSRSHSVFTLTIESKRVVEGVTNMKTSKFHFVDLAGSERQRLTAAAGSRLKEAGNINKSLTVLGSVINSLVDVCAGKKAHIRYRDSKLTFLLKDSIGGNSKTSMIANISPASINFGETLSTLKFAQRAKLIKNKASINEELTGSIEVLKKEIVRLKIELENFQKGIPSGINQNSISLETRNFDNGQSRIAQGTTQDYLEQQQKNLIEQNIVQLETEQLLAETLGFVEASSAKAKEESDKLSKLRGIYQRATSIGETRELHMRMLIDLYEEKCRRLSYNSWGEDDQKESLVRQNVGFLSNFSDTLLSWSRIVQLS